ncbi:MAG TPA: DUF2341 domain-containing protein [Opitutus sp.]|nr:DUF2341 domain-containing protein [Opitutus sp.]
MALWSALGWAVPAHAWWNSDWAVRKPVTIDTTPAGGAISDPIGSAVVLLRLHDGDFQFAAAKPDGTDLRFIAADDKTVLPYHIERFDALLDEAFVWVRVPDVKPGTKTSLWLYYGNPGAPRADDPKATYDADTVLIYHFAERGSAPADSSGNGNHAQGPGLSSDGSMIGGGLRLDGNAAVTIPGTPSDGWTEGAPMTWSAWIKFGAPQANAVIFSRPDGSSSFVIGANNNSPFVEVTNASGSQRSQAAAPISANSWHHVAVVADPAKVTLYLDGGAYATVAAHLPALDGPMIIGSGRSSGVAESALTGGGGFVGELDELEISRTARPAGWVKFSAVQEGGGDGAAKLLALGADEQPKSLLSWFKGGYVGIIISSLSVDGWVVIGILLVMMVISWIVMAAKARYLNRVAAGNERFLKEWRHVASDLSALEHEDETHAKSLGGRVSGAAGSRVMRDASLFRVYHVGIEEIRRRHTSDRSSRVLSARSIEAIRAALDGALVRETHRLNSQMVLLTIAISGGPFLGLLGTVVGVMITFAAVAAAGDVNVNAIAPGIAAALAATVAGLAVAIPSLFGYNYLLTRVKTATSDMHVFIDEFVAKMAEFYSESAENVRAATKAPFADKTTTPVGK